MIASTKGKMTDKVEEYNQLMSKMEKQNEQWKEEGEDDEEDKLLQNAIDLAIQQGRGWGPGEKEAYLESILDDDFIPPLFCSTAEQMEKTGLQEAFTSLIYDGESSTTLMLQFKKKGNDAFADGKRNQASNLEYFRTAINHYYEALAWALKVEPMMAGDLAQADTDDPTYTEDEINVERAKICTNTATAHAQLKNWGYVRDESKKALEYDDKNVKAWFRLSQAYTELREWEAAGDSLDKGLAVDKESKDLLKLQKRVAKQVQAARKRRQQRERARAERVAAVKAAWKHCQQSSIRLGRVPLVTSVTDDEEEDDEQTESRWHQHLPHSGQLPRLSNGDWMWPCMLLYPSHNQSDFIKDFSETEMIAIRLAQVFPEFEEAGDETEMPWDKENEFTCSQLALYIEFHSVEDDGVVHPESVEQLRDQASAMRFYETSRALKGDEGEDMANVARAVARQHLHKQRKAWKKKHGSLWAKPDPNPVLRIHPAMSLKDVLKDARVMIPNFLVTFVVIPETHPAHEAYLKDHKCVGILQPEASN